MIETAGKVVICYTIDKKHLEVKNAMKALGYFDDFWIFKQEKKYELTNGTLWHSKKRVSESTKDIKQICNELGVTLLKSFSVLASNEVDAYNGQINEVNQDSLILDSIEFKLKS